MDTKATHTALSLVGFNLINFYCIIMEIFKFYTASFTLTCHQHKNTTVFYSNACWNEDGTKPHMHHKPILTGSELHF